MDWTFINFFLGFMLVLAVLGGIAMMIFEGNLGERRSLNLAQGCCSVATAALYFDWAEPSTENFLGFGPPWLSQIFLLAFAALFTWGLVALATAFAWGWVSVTRKKSTQEVDGQEFRAVVTATMIVVAIMAILNWYVNYEF